MQDLLGACVELETLAVEVYALFAESSDDESLRCVFGQLQAEEREHISWWTDAQRRFDSGEIAPVESGTHVIAYMKAIVATLRAMLDSPPRTLTDDDCLALAASLEFFALDPVFAMLIRESDPSLGVSRGDAYAGHVGLLIATMESRGSWPLAPHIAFLRGASGAERGSAADDLHDPVTGLPLRPLAEQALNDLCSEPARDNEAISLALVDMSLGSLYERDPVRADGTLLRITSVATAILRFTDLLVLLDGHKLAVVMPATSSSTACATTATLADAVASVAAADSEGESSAWTTSAVVTLLPGRRRCDSATAFAAAEALLGEARLAGEPLAATELG